MQTIRRQSLNQIAIFQLCTDYATAVLILVDPLHIEKPSERVRVSVRVLKLATWRLRNRKAIRIVRVQKTQFIEPVVHICRCLDISHVSLWMWGQLEIVKNNNSPLNVDTSVGLIMRSECGIFGYLIWEDVARLYSKFW